MRRFILSLLLVLGALAVFSSFAWDRVLRPSNAPHFIYLADSILHGQLSLRLPPPNKNDWARYEGKFYVSFPPFPALLMLPGVALWGLKFNDVIFTLAFAAFNILLIFLVLERLAGTSGRPLGENLWLTGLFALGTVNFYCSILGRVWYTAHVLGVTLTCLYILFAWRARHPWLAGIFLALGFITRTPLLFAFPFFLGELLRTSVPSGADVPSRWRRLTGTVLASVFLRRLLAFAVPVVLVVGAMMVVNYLRFDDFFEFGHHHLWQNRIQAWVSKYGLFDYHYLEKNLHAAFTRLPVLKSSPPYLTFNGNGMSIFITTPAFLLLLWPRRKPARHRALWLTVLLTALPGFFYQNNGWYQFGYRFSLDYTPYLIMLLALGGWPLRWPFKALIIAGVAVNTWGAVVFGR